MMKGKRFAILHRPYSQDDLSQVFSHMVPSSSMDNGTTQVAFMNVSGGRKYV